MVPFSREAFLGVFAAYNTSAWFAEIVLVALALVAVVATFRGTERASALAGGVLVSLWLWMAIAYHWIYFVRVTPAAWLFGAMFLGQAALLGWALVAGRLRFGVRRDWTTAVGLLTILYALVIYPLIGSWSDHAYPRAPSFGLPCPTTIFTLGMLALTVRPVPKVLLAIPVAWAVVASMAPFKFGIWEDLGLEIAALGVAVTLAARDHRRVLSTRTRCRR